MIAALRISGFLLIALGTLLIVSWLFEPLRRLWPVLLALPLPVKIGLVVAAIGLAVLMGALLAERLEQRRAEGDLLNDDLDP